MIILTRLGNGLPVAVNPDLIERAEPTPDTVVTLVDGHKLVVEEPVEDVVELIRAWRAGIAACAIRLARGHECDTPAGRIESTEPDQDAENAVLAQQASHGSPLGRILRLPSREA